LLKGYGEKRTVQKKNDTKKNMRLQREKRWGQGVTGSGVGVGPTRFGLWFLLGVGKNERSTNKRGRKKADQGNKSTVAGGNPVGQMEGGSTKGAGRTCY